MVKKISNIEKSFDESEIIVSKTDLKGKITYCNEIFIKMSGYSQKELLGTPHNIIRHPDMPKVIFKLLWEYIKSGKEIFAYVKNLCKDGSYYWVLANVTASKDLKKNIIGYYSVRRKPKEEAIDKISAIYKELLDIERRDGVSASENYLNLILDKRGVSYDKFILSI